jgi:hypothetical protein
VDVQDVGTLPTQQLAARQRLERGDPLGQGGAGVAEEAPGGLALGLGRGRLARQGLGAAGERLGAALVLLDQQRVTPLQPFVKVGK